MTSWIGIVIFWAGTASATTTFVGADRASSVTLADGTTVIDPIIYGGIAGECSSTSDESTCNSCANVNNASLSDLTPCNKKRIHNDLYLQITARSDNTSVNDGDMVLKFDDTDDGDVIARTQNVQANADITLSVLWRDVCTAAGSSDGCTADINEADFQVGFTAANSEDFVEDADEIKIVVQTMDSTDQFHEDCFSLDDPSSVTGGFCQFEVERGDEKAEVVNLNTEQTVRTPHNGTQHMSSIRFFCKEVSETLCNGTAAGANLVSELGDISLSDNDCLTKTYDISGDSIVFPKPGILITGAGNAGSNLVNDRCYGFVMASEDLAGNIGYFSSESFLETNFDAGYSLVVSPTQSTGLLDESENCALVYLLGPNSPTLPGLRWIRDHVIQPQWWGPAFIKSYYSTSPLVVEHIKRPSIVHQWIAYLWAMIGLFLLFSLSRRRRFP